MSGAPVLVLGVSRSGTTLLRVMLDRNPELAVPDESFFVPPLAHRHGAHPDPGAFLDDLRRLPRLREWDVDLDDVRARLRPGMTTGEAIAAIYEAYAAARGKRRWGDKTPLYLQYLPLLERLFPEALYVHLVRDGRDAAVSYLAMPKEVVARTRARLTSAEDFAAEWRTDVEAARRLGARVGPERYLECRYEHLVESPEHELRRICAFAGLPFDPAMLAYADEVDVASKPHQQSLRRSPTPGLRDWRTALPAADVERFEAVAGDLLAALGYETRTDPARSPSVRGRLRLARYRAASTAWRAAAYAAQRSPLWRRRHPVLA